MKLSNLQPDHEEKKTCKYCAVIFYLARCKVWRPSARLLSVISKSQLSD